MFVSAVLPAAHPARVFFCTSCSLIPCLSFLLSFGGGCYRLVLIGRLIYTIFFIFRPIRLKREDDLTKGAMLKFFCEALERHPDLSLFLTQVKRTTPYTARTAQTGPP